MKVMIALLAFVSFVLFESTFGQESKTDEQLERTKKGEQLMLELPKHRQLLPRRWACSIDYDIESTPDEEKLIWIRGTQYIAEDRDLEIKVQRRNQSDAQRDENEALGEFEELYFDWSRKKEKLRWNDGQWVVTKAGEKRPHFDPFMLCVANSTILQQGMIEDYVEFYFLGRRSCLTSKVAKNGVESIWGLPERSDSGFAFCWFVLHDPQTGLPISFKSRYYEKWDPKNLDAANKLTNHVETKWLTIKPQNIVVPVEVSSEWMNNESFEANFTMKWLFGEDVPDSAFVDPRIEKLQVLDFSNKSLGN